MKSERNSLVPLVPPVAQANTQSVTLEPTAERPHPTPRQIKNMSAVKLQLNSSIQRKAFAKPRFATPKIFPRQGSKATTIEGQTGLMDNTTLPKIEFGRINKIRVQNLWQGTGKALRDDLLATGGFSKFYRTKR